MARVHHVAKLLPGSNMNMPHLFWPSKYNSGVGVPCNVSPTPKDICNSAEAFQWKRSTDKGKVEGREPVSDIEILLDGCSFRRSGA